MLIRFEYFMHFASGCSLSHSKRTNVKLWCRTSNAWLHSCIISHTRYLFSFEIITSLSLGGTSTFFRKTSIINAGRTFLTNRWSILCMVLWSTVVLCFMHFLMLKGNTSCNGTTDLSTLIRFSIFSMNLLLCLCAYRKQAYTRTPVINEKAPERLRKS